MIKLIKVEGQYYIQRTRCLLFKDYLLNYAGKWDTSMKMAGFPYEDKARLAMRIYGIKETR